MYAPPPTVIVKQDGDPGAWYTAPGEMSNQYGICPKAAPGITSQNRKARNPIRFDDMMTFLTYRPVGRTSGATIAAVL
jgi:hypothetical protein